MIRATVDIAVDPDFGYAKALRVVQVCSIKKLYGDSEKRMIRIILIDNIEEAVKCLSSIKGFFNVYIRLLINLPLGSNVWQKLGLKPAPKSLSKRVIGYIEIENHLCLIEKVPKSNKFLVKVLKTKNPPVILEPSMYLVYGDNTTIVDNVLKYLKILQTLMDRVNAILSRKQDSGQN